MHGFILSIMLDDNLADWHSEAGDESSLLIRIPKALTLRQIDMSIERIFLKRMSFERGRHTRNPTRSNTLYSLTNPIKVETYKMAFDVYEQILLAEITKRKYQITS